MTESKVRASKEGAIGLILLNDGKVNSYDMGFMRDLDAAIDETINDQDVKVGVLHSGSPKGVFSAGADIKAFLANSVEGNLEMIHFAHMALRKMAKSEKIFIAAIAGGAYGGGLEIALACDFRFASQGDYKLGLPEVTLGLLPGNGGTVRLPRLIGYQRALEMMVTGRLISPQVAFEWGVVDRIVDGDVVAEAVAWANKLAGQATMAIGRIKRSVMDGMSQPIDVALDNERALIADLFESADAKEGLTAFAERRKAEFLGR